MDVDGQGRACLKQGIQIVTTGTHARSTRCSASFGDRCVGEPVWGSLV